MSFETFNFSPDILRAIRDEGYTLPTEVQKQAIPLILSGCDLLAGSQTGTGKTAGYMLPLLQNLLSYRIGQGIRTPRALILTPTRELAAQVHESVRNYGKYLPFRSTAIFGGVNMKPQITHLRKGIDILVATPGRLLDHVSQGFLNLSKVDFFVLDEADRMLDMGFIHDIRKIIALIPKSRQSLLFSATYSEEVKKLSESFLKDPKKIQVSQGNSAATLVSQMVYKVDNGKKKALLSHLIVTKGWNQVLVFTRTKHTANRLSDQLENEGIRSAAIHGNKSQSARTKALGDFKKGNVQVLVATDLAARGLDIDDLPHVVNFELPHSPEDYVHRIGRTGRAGRSGEAVSLVCIDEHNLLKGIEKLLKKSITQSILPGFEPDQSIKAQPITRGRNSSRHRSRRKR